MKAIAKFAMQGRLQAIGIALVTASFPFLHWLCSAVVCLVILRKGLVEGLVVLMWASLPMLVLMLMYQDPSPILALVAVVIMAYVLRTTSSWEMTLITSVVVSAVAALIFEAVSADVFVTLIEMTKKLQVDLGVEANLAAKAKVPDAAALHDMWFGILAGAYAVTSVLFLALARWWQSELYNEGGFGLEFRALRLSPALAMVLALAVVGLFVVDSYSRWYLLLMMPMMMAAIGLVHWVVAEKEMSRGWLVSFYLMLILMSQLIMPFLATLAVMDSWLNLRNRIRSDREE